MIGTSTGGGVDLYARLVAQFLGKHLPGEPVIIAQNMPGASSVVAANYLYTVAKPDGLTLGALQGGAFFDQVLGHNTVKFDWAEVYLDRLAGTTGSAALHARRQSVQNPRRYSPRR